jgi:hypothetical protein
MVARMTSGGWIISHRCSWITAYVLCCNAQVNLIVIFMTCTCIALHSLFCQLPNYNLFTQHVIYLYGETPLVNYGPRSIMLMLTPVVRPTKSQLASTFSKWFLSPTGRLNLGFILRENLPMCSSYLLLGVPNWAASTAITHTQDTHGMTCH